MQGRLKLEARKHEVDSLGKKLVFESSFRPTEYIIPYDVHTTVYNPRLDPTRY